MLIWPFFRFLREIPDIIECWGLPRSCRYCELLGLCRRPKEEGWKCYDGCMILNEKFEGLPRRCWHCEYLKECRRPKEEGWKCYDGCRVIKEKRGS